MTTWLRILTYQSLREMFLGARFRRLLRIGGLVVTSNLLALPPVGCALPNAVELVVASNFVGSSASFLRHAILVPPL